ncbi:MAG: hypothetical protein JNM93_04190 [Bacteriovoracaceae bacterium]|nr:hypothetical protein [Bacteriovoracaceae bacterium]
MKFFVNAAWICLVFVCQLAHGQVLKHWNNPYFQKILVYSQYDQEKLKNIDNHRAIVENKSGMRLDLIVDDFIDQVTLVLQKNRYEKYQSILNIVKHNSVENFANFLKELEKTAAADKDFKKQLNRIDVIEYSLYGTAMAMKPKLLKNGRWDRLKDIQHIQKYNLLATLPEGRSVLEHFSNLIVEPFITKNFTATKFQKLNKSRVRRMLVDYNYEYLELLANQEVADRELYQTDGYFDYTLRPRKKKLIKISPDVDVEEIANKTVPLYNTIQKLSYKIPFLDFLNHQLQNKIPTGQIEYGTKVYLLTPSFTHHYRDEIFEALREFQFNKLISEEDDQMLQAMRHWVNKNQDLVESKIGYQFKRKIPTRTEIIENAEKISDAFTDRPWLNGKTFFNKGNKEIRYGDSKNLRALHQSFQFFKTTFTPESLAGLAVGTASTIITANPYAGVIGYSLTYDSIHALRYGKKWSQQVVNNSPRRILLSSIMASSMVAGELQHAVTLGALSGATQSVLTGRPLALGIMVGGVVDGALVYLPKEFSQLVVKGMDKNLENGLIEILQTSAKTSFRGFIIAVLDDGDGIKGAKEGAVYGVGESLFKILVLGFRYDPTDLVTEEDIQKYLEKEHNPVLTERAYNGKPMEWNKSDFNRFVFRKNAPLKYTKIYKVFHDPKISHEIAGNGSMAPGDEADVDTLIHESLHFAQEEKFGFLHFIFKYIKSTLQYDGKSIYEDYVSI